MFFNESFMKVLTRGIQMERKMARELVVWWVVVLEHRHPPYDIVRFKKILEMLK